MSGIAALSGRAEGEVLDRVLDKLKHRGPEGSRCYLGDEVALGCVSSLTSGTGACQQPIYNEDGRLCIVADASIYNRERLRRGLSSHRFDTWSDAEVILHLYEEYGPSCPERLDGIYAFVINDGGELFAARDPLGVKPLYYSRSNGGLAFASELKALAGVVPDVQGFPPGYSYSSKLGPAKYFEFERSAAVDLEPKEAVGELRTALGLAVQKRMTCDVPTGVLLSGGLDSSVVAYVAAGHADNVHSFAVGIKGSGDLTHARLLAKSLGLRHHERVYDLQEMLEVLPQVIYYLESFDHLLVRSSIANYFASKLASDYVKAVLCGEGADELFAGYDDLKQSESDEGLNAALLRMVFDCHNTGLQRVDRMNMANGVEAHVPFFDLDLVRFAFRIPAGWKIHGRERVEKWILRKAFETCLPKAIAWRAKQKFSVGAGSCRIMSEVADQRISDEAFDAEKSLPNSWILRNKEELMYYRIFRGFFGDSPAVLNTVGRSR